MNAKLLAATALLSLTAAGAAHAVDTVFYGPTPYLSQADAPFHPADFTNFYLEDVEDNAINTLGLHVSGPSLCIAGFDCFVGSGLTDSVGNGGNGQLGRSIWTNGSTTITFDQNELGTFPTYAGLVWTDGVDPINFEAFDQNGVSLGGIFDQHHADGSFAGTLEDDRFYGLTHLGGISKLVITDNPGQEIDHIQYGFSVIPTEHGVPEPAAWALMLTGFAGLGAVLRRRRAAQTLQGV